MKLDLRQFGNWLWHNRLAKALRHALEGAARDAVSESLLGLLSGKKYEAALKQLALRLGALEVTLNDGYPKRALEELRKLNAELEGLL